MDDEGLKKKTTSHGVTEEQRQTPDNKDNTQLQGQPQGQQETTEEQKDYDADDDDDPSSVSLTPTTNTTTTDTTTTSTTTADTGSSATTTTATASTMAATATAVTATTETAKDTATPASSMVRLSSLLLIKLYICQLIPHCVYWVFTVLLLEGNDFYYYWSKKLKSDLYVVCVFDFRWVYPKTFFFLRLCARGQLNNVMVW